MKIFQYDVTSQLAGQQLSVNDLPVVMEELNDIRAKWYDIGLQLRVSVGTLDAIKEQYDDPSHCLRETLKTWLKTYPSPPTWSNIVTALRSRIGEVRLAADLEQKYCSTQDSSVAATHHHALPAPPSQADTQTTPPQQSQSQAHTPPAPPVSPSQAHTQMTPLPPQSTIPPTQPPVLAYSETPPSHPPSWSVPYDYSPHASYPLPTPFPLTAPPPGVTTASVQTVTPTSSRPLLPSVPAQPTTPQHLPSSEKMQLLGKHSANTQAETSSSKRQRNLYTSDTLSVGWKPDSSGAATFVHPSYSQPSQVTPLSSRPLLSSLPAPPTTPQFPTAFPQYPSPPSLTTIPPDTSSIQLLATVTTPPDLPPPVTAHSLGMKVLSHEIV